MVTSPLRPCLASLCLASVAGPATPACARAQDQSVTTYHGDASRSGHYIVPGLTWERARAMHHDAAFQGVVSGHVYAQPLYWHPSGSDPGLLIVATENNDVYALNAETGAEVWKRSLGTPVLRVTLPCGNVDPVGITGTPAIDATTQALYLDAVVAGSASPDPQHLIYALSLRDGSVLPGWPVNVVDALRRAGMTFSPRVQSERGALLVQGDAVYVPYGGHWGDCGDYHGWVVRVALHDPTQVAAWSTRARAGGIWAQGGVVSDGQSLFVATGNTRGAQTWSDGEAIIRLGADLAAPRTPANFFAPTDWDALDNRDADLGGTAPLPLDLPGASGPTSVILALGKNGKAYLADRGTLGGIGGELASWTVANRPIITAAATWPTTAGAMAVFHGAPTECPGHASGAGVVALEIGAGSPPTLRTAWCAPLDGAGAPIVTTSSTQADPIVWITGAEGDNRLHGFRGDTGEEVFGGGGAAEEMAGLRHFGTILVARRRLYVAGDGRIYAFTF
jgi:outer membrane protein assembly factor BamB